MFFRSNLIIYLTKNGITSTKEYFFQRAYYVDLLKEVKGLNKSRKSSKIPFTSQNITNLYYLYITFYSTYVNFSLFEIYVGLKGLDGRHAYDIIIVYRLLRTYLELKQINMGIMLFDSSFNRKVA